MQSQLSGVLAVLIVGFATSPALAQRRGRQAASKNSGYDRAASLELMKHIHLAANRTEQINQAMRRWVASYQQALHGDDAKSIEPQKLALQERTSLALKELRHVSRQIGTAIRTYPNAHGWVREVANSNVQWHKQIIQTNEAVLRGLQSGGSEAPIGADPFGKTMYGAPRHVWHVVPFQNALMLKVLLDKAELGPDPGSVAGNDESFVRDRPSYGFLKKYYQTIGDIPGDANRVEKYQQWIQAANDSLPEEAVDPERIRTHVQLLKQASRQRAQTLAETSIDASSASHVRPVIVRAVQAHHAVRVKMHTLVLARISACESLLSTGEIAYAREANRIGQQLHALELQRLRCSVGLQSYASLLSTGVLLGAEDEAEKREVRE